MIVREHLSLKEIEEREKQKKQERISQRRNPFNRTKVCEKCGGKMVYVFGETFECTECKNRKLTDFGKIREYLEINGPQTAVTISRDTGVDVKKIQSYLDEGRIEISESSDVYIKCQICGADIRYGKICSECAAKMSRTGEKGMFVGEKIKPSGNNGSRMHTMHNKK